ncbi:hypothetical protein RJ641_028898 [Dillenia turbinata]|uniref:DNA-directed RNA polymerase subunit n=1 Tax=Dillenia turbinata TaxID=194707 RepID=A0AAN8W0S8_9MAGN
MEGLKVSDANMVIYVHPSNANKVSVAVHRELNSLLFQYNEIFEGVVLAYQFDIPSETAKILPGVDPYIGVRLKAKLLIFAPKPGMLVEGKVVKVARESIHVVVLGFSSAIIIDNDIREEFIYKIKHGEEVFASTSQKRHVIKVGTTIRFQVKSFDEEILHFSGSLIPAHTGSIRWLEKYLKDDSQSSRHNKKHEERDEREDVLLHGDLAVDEGAVLLDNSIKKLKKQRIGEEF